MRFRNRTRDARRSDKERTATTALIDIVFLLLVFFVMTFRVVLPEGDFRIDQARQAGAPQDVPPPESLPVRVRLRADAEGRLAAIELGERRLEDLAELRRAFRQLAAESEPEVELDCDAALQFEHTIRALTAVSGYVERGEIVPMTCKVRFIGPR